mgnify:CR=1 FL=1
MSRSASRPQRCLVAARAQATAAPPATKLKAADRVKLGDSDLSVSGEFSVLGTADALPRQTCGRACRSGPFASDDAHTLPFTHNDIEFRLDCNLGCLPARLSWEFPRTSRTPSAGPAAVDLAHVRMFLFPIPPSSPAHQMHSPVPALSLAPSPLPPKSPSPPLSFPSPPPQPAAWAP